MKKLLALLGAVFSLAACETISYYGQAVAGQFYILSHRKQIETLITSEGTDPHLKGKLSNLLDIRAFAEQELGLPVKNSFSTYVDVKRPYVVWNVFATPEFSMNPVRWCYPIAGCVSYRGYFNERGARRFARSLEKQGYDVYVGGVAAYSTLGWFSDPLLNTVVGRDDHQLASLVFHEMAHQLVYVPGDTEFNESFATAVEQEGLRRWLESNGWPDEERSRILRGVSLEMDRRADFVDLVQDAVAKLRKVYTSQLQPEDMRVEKQRILAAMREEYDLIKERWDGYNGYDAWFRKDLNNAQLNTVATYFQWVPAFNRMLEEEGGDLQRFYARVRALARADRKVRTAYLESRVAFAARDS